MGSNGVNGSTGSDRHCPDLAKGQLKIENGGMGCDGTWNMCGIGSLFQGGMYSFAACYIRMALARRIEIDFLLVACFVLFLFFVCLLSDSFYKNVPGNVPQLNRLVFQFFHL